MDSNQLVATITAIACELAKDKDAAEIAQLASIFNQLGETLDTILVNEEFQEAKSKLHL